MLIKNQKYVFVTIICMDHCKRMSQLSNIDGAQDKKDKDVSVRHALLPLQSAGCRTNRIPSFEPIYFVTLPQSPTNGARGPNMGSNIGPSLWKVCIRKNRKEENDEVERGITKLSSTWLKESSIGMFRRERNHSRNLQNLLWEQGNSSLKEHCSVWVRNSYFPSVQLFFINNTIFSYKLCVIVVLKFWSITPIIRYPTSFCCLFSLLTYAFLCVFWFLTWFWMFSFFN